MNRSIRVPLLAATLLLAVPAIAGAQDKPPTQEEIAKLQAMMMESMAPGPEHERLARLAGRWATESRIWPAPGAQPMVVSGTAESRMILGGRFLLTEAATASGPMSGESMMIFGFDRRNDVYTSAAYDSYGTYGVMAKGGFDLARNAIVMGGSDTVESAGHTQTWDFVVREVDADTWVFEIVFTDPVHTRGGEPFKMVEVTYRRASGS